MYNTIGTDIVYNLHNNNFCNDIICNLIWM